MCYVHRMRHALVLALVAACGGGAGVGGTGGRTSTPTGKPGPGGIPPALFSALYVDGKTFTYRVKTDTSFYDDSGAIGRRYRRMDEAGTPFGITVDGETTSGRTVTIRHRDSMQQERVSLGQVGDYVAERVGAAP